MTDNSSIRTSFESCASDQSFRTSASSARGDQDDADDNVADESNHLQTTFRLRVFASNLPRRGKFKNRLPDSFALVTATQSSSQTLASGGVRLGATEVIRNSRSPQWTTTFQLDYTYGTQHFFNVLVLEPSDGDSEFTTSDGFGSASFDVADILGTKHRTRARVLRRGGVVFCRLDPVQQEFTQRFAVFRLAARNLVPPNRKFRMFSAAPDTIIKIARIDATSRKWTTVYRSQPVQESFNPAWDRIEVDLGTLCEGNTSTTLRFSVSMVRENRRAVMIGMCETSLDHLLAGVSTLTGTTLPDTWDENLPTFSLQRNVERLKQVGQIVVRRAYLYEILPDGSRKMVDGNDEEDETEDQQKNGRYRPLSASLSGSISGDESSSLDASVAGDLRSVAEKGCDLNCFIAIDFTSSNGDPKLESSLHYQSPSLNVYEETIATVAGYLEEQVNVSSGYSVWGFGAKFVGDGVVRHVFQCGNETCHSVADILDAYKSIFSLGFTMSGPTVFDKVMQGAAYRAKQSMEHIQAGRFQYNLLLIITDGTVQNMEETRRKMTVYRDLPLSIILVGVGRADMQELRMLCQEFPDKSIFVDFRENQSNPAELANAALGDLPRQITKYINNKS